MKSTTKLGARKWLSFIIAGLIGQISWAIENMYLNVYAFHCTSDYIFIPIMTAASAAAATLTTLFIGALSDRIGKRKSFISFGYIIWGISIIAFAFLDPTSSYSFVSNSALLAGTLIVIMDCVMTFFGSTANDAAFNAFVTDSTDTTNRGKVESFLSILPMVAMIAIVVLQGLFVTTTEGMTKGWDIFFYVFGGITSLAGLALLFIIPKDTIQPNKTEPYMRNIVYGFRPSVIKKNPILYLVLLGFLCFNMAFQVFFPYFLVYIQNVLLIQETNFMITMGVVLVIACIFTIAIGLFMDKIGKNKLLIPAIGLTAIGAFLFIFVGKENVIFAIIAGVILMSGYMVSTAVFGAKVRDYTPPTQAGLFQGVRMVFVVLIPMVTGPYIGQGLSNINATTYINEYGNSVVEPNNFIFLGTFIVLLIAIIPVIFLLKKERQVYNERQITSE
jgi:MFS family permease